MIDLDRAAEQYQGEELSKPKYDHNHNSAILYGKLSEAFKAGARWVHRGTFVNGHDYQNSEVSHDHTFTIKEH